LIVAHLSFLIEHMGAASAVMIAGGITGELQNAIVPLTHP
jgi:hypothetical protein